MTVLENETEIRWVKHGNKAYTSVLGKDIVVLSSGNFITFVETSRLDKKEILYNANSEKKGDGIQCICTHGTLSCFAFAEKCRNPRILIVSYPSFEIFKSFDSMTETNYIALRFSEMEFLFALTGITNYKIVIWNWRTAEKLYVQETPIHSPNQIIRISPTSPMQIIQSNLEERSLTLWNMNICYKKTLLQKKSITLPDASIPPYCFCYGADGEIYFVDFGGSLYSINPETYLCSLQYSFSGLASPKYIPCMTWYKGGIVFATPNEILFLRRKSPEGWTKIWSLIPKAPFRSLMTSNLKDLLLGVTVTNEIMVFKGEHPIECTSIKNFGADFEFLGFINPVGDYFFTFGNSTKVLNLWNKTNGQKVSQLVWTRDKINALVSNPKWPYLVVTTDEGTVHLINVYDPTNPFEFNTIFLTTNVLDAVRFRNQGTQFCVANMDVGEFFLLKVSAKLEVIGYIKLDLKIVDYAIVDKDINMLTLLIVPMSQLCCRSGQTILLYGLNEKQKAFEYLKDVVMPTVVTAIHPSPLTFREIFCIPHRSRNFYVINFLNGKMTANFVSGHQMKFISMNFNADYMYTFGIDGLVIVKLADSKTCATVFSSHHRLAKGIKTLAIDPYTSYVITLGENGSLVCTYLKKLENQERRQDLEALMLTTTYKQLLAATVAKAKGHEKHDPEEIIEAEVPWVVLRQKELINLEEHQSRKEKQNILEELETIKQQVRQMLDENLRNPPERQLPIRAFDLDKTLRQKKLEEAKMEREKERLIRQASMKNLGKITDLIKSICWESVSVKGREIHAILASLAVQSYALLPESKSFKLKMTWLTEINKINQFINLGDYFDPWLPRTARALEEHLNSKLQVSTVDVTQTIKTKYEEEQTEDEKTKAESEEQMSKHVWSGTSTHNFVETDPKHYSQFELTTFNQSHQEVYFIENDIKKLMLWFNKNFAETFELKEREMAFVVERNNRFRHIINELNFFNFSPEICKTQIYDPEWAPEENPETIMTVKDEEIKVPMYISDSEMELKKKKEAEEERIRQLMMADDFKEKALIDMMDGVLEKLWEDEIKKDIPKPKCLVEKEPEAWTEDDLKAVRAYEDAVRFLASERERYRKILEAEWFKTISIVKDSVSKFDEKVAKLHVLKLKVESAIGQEILKCLRIRLRCFERILLDRKKDSLKTSMIKNEKNMEWKAAELNKLMEMLNECKNFYETLQTKDKNLDKNFKKEFPELSPIICEQLYKISKKRPKLPQKTTALSTVLNDMGRCAVSGTKPEYLPADCIQYLKDLDALDAYSNAPATVSQQTWESACKLRRLKIDAELKIRACTIDMADAEATVITYQRALKAAKDYQVHLHNDLTAVRAEKINASLNYQIQLVLKKGLVEIPLSGRISDFKESILVTKDAVCEVNKAIQKMGRQKIKSMKKAANFRKGIIYKEWEHKKLRMEIEDLKGKLNSVEKLQVLKELQAILVARARGFSDEKGFLYMENELAKVKERFEKTQTEIFMKMDALDAKIEQLNLKKQELDLKIMELNVEVNEMNLSRDVEFDKKTHEENLRRMKKLRERANLIRKIQEQHNEILILQTELELLRLKTYPSIKYKIS